MYDFKLQRPTSLEAATKALAAADDGKYLAGGMTLIPTMKQRLAQPSDLIDLGAIDALSGIHREGDELVIGATTTHAEVAACKEVRSAIPALAELANHIGDPAVRARGTIGGSIVNADPAADYPAAVVGLAATVQTNKRSVAADDFFTGLFETVLDDDELVTAVRFPIPARAGYAKFPNPASRYAVVGVLVAEGPGGTRVAVTGAGASVFRVADMEKALAGDFSPQAVADISVPASGLNSDIHASDEYRAHLVTVMAKRAVASALG